MPTVIRALRRVDPRLAAVAFAVTGSLWFAVDPAPVGDLWAAEARESAALHGVGLTYWFSWFGGIVPGNYSVLTPLISPFVHATWLGAVATVAIIGLCRLLVRDTRHPVAATWFSAVGATMSLWSGRIPFAVGTAFLLGALVFLRGNRPVPTGVAAAATALTSPVSGVFLVLGVAGVVIHDRRRRPAAVTGAAVAGACLLAEALYFGMPGSEGYPLVEAVLSFVGVAILLWAKPPGYLRTVVVISLAVCPLLVLVPNGMGSNFDRFAWICLPAAVAATGRARAWRTSLAAGVAVAIGVVGTAHDLYVAAQPPSSEASYASLVTELDRLPGLTDHRVEIVDNGTHVAAFALLGHAQLAGGDETQAANEYNGVLASPALNAHTYRAWLDANAVAYVGLSRRTLSENPEYRLVRDGRPGYLLPVWSDADWELFAVRGPAPIVAAPAQVTAASQSSMEVLVPRPGRYELRVHWSRFLQTGSTGARLVPDRQGWTVLDATAPGSFTLTGR